MSTNKIEYHKDSDGNLILGEDNIPIPLTTCICAAWVPDECGCGSWLLKDYYDWDKDDV